MSDDDFDMEDLDWDPPSMPEEFTRLDLRIKGACVVRDKNRPEREVVKYEVEHETPRGFFGSVQIGFFITPTTSRLGKLLLEEIDKAQRGN